MLAGFAIEGFVLSAIWIHMVPLTGTLGLGTTGLIVSILFGPAQVASRLINMLFGGQLPQSHLAMLAACLARSRSVHASANCAMGARRLPVRGPFRVGFRPN